MNHSLHIRPHAVNCRMHQNLAGDVASTLYFHSPQVANHQLFRLHHAFTDAGWSRQKSFRIQANGDIAVICRNPAFLVHQAANFDDILAVLSFRQRHSRNYNGSAQAAARGLRDLLGNKVCLLSSLEERVCEAREQAS